jgi:hypothetical protein
VTLSPIVAESRRPSTRRIWPGARSAMRTPKMTEPLPCRTRSSVASAAGSPGEGRRCTKSRTGVAMRHSGSFRRPSMTGVTSVVNALIRSRRGARSGAPTGPRSTPGAATAGRAANNQTVAARTLPM